MRVTTLLARILGIKYTRVVDVQFEGDGLLLGVAPSTRQPRCSGCGRVVHAVYDGRERRWRHLDVAGMGGDPVQAQAWTGKTKARTKPLPIGSSNLPPEDAKVRNVKAHPGMILASCAKEQSAVSYAFQMGTDQAHPETWPAQVVSRGHTYKVGNLPIGQVVYLRIAVIRRGSIQGAWSAIMPIQVR